MAQQITSSQYNTANQTTRNFYVKINLLDFNYAIVDSLEGNIISGNVNVDANSDLRRTCNLTFVVTGSTFLIQPGGEIWLDKLVQLFVGVEDIRTAEVSWTNLGIFLINQPTYTYDATTKTMQFQGVDLMAKLTGLRNGVISGISADSYTLIEVGTNVREAIIGVLSECGIRNYYVSECKNVDGVIQDVPYDMKFEQGATWFDVLEELRNILPNYQMYFDVDGVFRYEPIPSSADDPIMINDDLWENNVLSETVNVDFEGVKNVIEVWGRVHEVERFSDASETIVNVLEISPTWADFTITDYVMAAFSLPQEIEGGSSITINFKGRYLIKDSSGNNITELDANTYYVVAFHPDGYWLFLGGNQAYGTWSDDNPQSPFYTGSGMGRIVEVLYGDEYDNIISDDLALQRAKYEIYKKCRLNDSVVLNTVPIYWADVNWKVSYTFLDAEEPKEYIIQSIDIPLDFSGTQTFNMSRFYPLYPVI